jgi:hypothetical protein
MSSTYRRSIPIDEYPDPPSASTETEEERPNRDAKIEELERQLAAIRERDNLYREFQEFQEKVDSEIKRNVRNFGLGSIIFVIITLFGIFAASFGIYQ